MADKPKDTNSDTPIPGDDPRDAVQNASDAADNAAEGIAASPAADEESAAALAAAMAAISQVKQTADNAASPKQPASAGAPPLGRVRPDEANAKPFTLADLGATLSKSKKETLDLLSDVQLHVRIELGRTRMYVEDVLQLGDGAVVELDKLAGDPVDVFVNDRHVARGEVLVLNDNFCVRINEILDPGAERSG
jgi:flagellar motor switch protein FliN/FliY